MKHPLSPKYIRSLLDYNQETGDFVWRERQIRDGYDFSRIDKGWNTRFAGKPVAKVFRSKGDLQIGLHCHNYAAHRIAWVMVYGEWPAKDIDHINGNPADNRIANLRLATDSENLCNQKKRIDNTSGVKGVSWSKKEEKWYAYINKNKKMIGLGRFHSFEDAVAARRAAEKQYHGNFARPA